MGRKETRAKEFILKAFCRYSKSYYSLLGKTNKSIIFNLISFLTEMWHYRANHREPNCIVRFHEELMLDCLLKDKKDSTG